MKTEPLVLELDEFEKMAFQKAVDDKAAAERAYRGHDATLRRLVAMLMRDHELSQEEWPFVEFDRLSMGIVRFQPAPKKEEPPPVPDRDRGTDRDPARKALQAPEDSPPPSKKEEAPSDPTSPPPEPRLLPAADGNIPEMEWMDPPQESK